MGQFSLTHIILVLIIVLIFFGPSKLPQLGQSLGQAIRGFKSGMDDLRDEMNNLSTKPEIAAQQSPSKALEGHLQEAAPQKSGNQGA